MPLRQPPWRTSRPRYARDTQCTSQNEILILYQAVRANLQEAQKVLGGNGSEEDKAEARVEADVYESLQHALGTK
jgi:hypothetical protein